MQYLIKMLGFNYILVFTQSFTLQTHKLREKLLILFKGPYNLDTYPIPISKIYIQYLYPIPIIKFLLDFYHRICTVN